MSVIDKADLILHAIDCEVITMRKDARHDLKALHALLILAPDYVDIAYLRLRMRQWFCALELEIMSSVLAGYHAKYDDLDNQRLMLAFERGL